jgi:hypothetical protein
MAWLTGPRTVPVMSTTSPHPQPFRNFDESVSRLLGADLRLIYGFAVPILMIVGMIVVFALSPSTWLLAAIMVLEIAALVVVVFGFVGMLNEGEDDEAAGLP